MSFEGFHRDVSPWYRRAAVSCLVSQYEGLGMAHTEAQQYGAVPIGFRMASLDYVTAGGAGIKARPYSIRDYSRKLLGALHHPERLRRMAESSIVASQRYDCEAIATEWLRLLRGLRRATCSCLI